MCAPNVPVICTCGYDGQLTSPLCPLHGERGLTAQVERLQLDKAKLRDAFIEYGKHHLWCSLEHHAPGIHDCGCGFVGALRSAAKLESND